MNNSPKQLFTVANILSFTLLFVVWLFVAFMYPQLPQTIALQFDSSGEVSRTGPKCMVFILPVVYTYLWLQAYRWDRQRFDTIKILNQTPMLRLVLQLVGLTVIALLLHFTFSSAI